MNKTDEFRVGFNYTHYESALRVNLLTTLAGGLNMRKRWRTTESIAKHKMCHTIKEQRVLGRLNNPYMFSLFSLRVHESHSFPDSCRQLLSDTCHSQLYLLLSSRYYANVQQRCCCRFERRSMREIVAVSLSVDL